MALVKLINLETVYPILREKLFKPEGLNPPVVPVYYARSRELPDYVAASTRYDPRTELPRDIRMNNPNVTAFHGDPPNTELEQVATLAHEIIHTLFELHEEAEFDGHGPNFGNIATRIGLTGPLKATVAGPRLQAWAKANLKLGDYRTNAQAYGRPASFGSSVDWLAAIEAAMRGDDRARPFQAWSNRYSRPTPLVGDMVRWENGELNQGEEDALFQHLVDSGLAWSLQGMYGRKAAELAHAGRIIIANTGEDMGLSHHNLTTEGLASMLKQAADAHHDYEKGLGHEDEDWPTWYAAWMRNMFGDGLDGGGFLNGVENLNGLKPGYGSAFKALPADYRPVLEDMAARGNPGASLKAQIYHLTPDE